MVDSTKAHSVNNGIYVDELSSGPFYTGGSASPVGQNLPLNTFYLQHSSTGSIIWRKYGSGTSDWVKASPVDFREYSESLTESSTTSTTYQTKVTDSAYLPVGDYLIKWRFWFKGPGPAYVNSKYKVTFDSSTVVEMTGMYENTTYMFNSGFRKASVATAGTKTWKIEYGCVVAYGLLSYIKEASLEIYRV